MPLTPIPEESNAGSGSVTSVGLTVPSILTVTGSPITTTGTLAVTLANQSANTILAGPTTGAAATPTFRALVAADLPSGTGTVTSITAGTGLSGGTITTTGTIAMPNTGPGAGTIGAAGGAVQSITLDAQGRVTAAVGVSNILTGTASATGDLFYSTSGTGALTALADVAAGSYLRSGGVAAAPVWSTLVLPNAATTGDVLIATSSNTIGRLADVAVNQVLLSGGIGLAPSWGTVPNAALTNSTIGVLAGTGLTGGGTSALGSSATISMPSVGPGAGTVGGSGIASITLDAQGRVTAAATATYLTSASAFYQTVQANTVAQTQRANLNFGSEFTLTDSAANNRTTVDIATGGVSNAMLASSSLTVTAGAGLTGGGSISLGSSATVSVGGTADATYSTGAFTWAGASAKNMSLASSGTGTITITAATASTWNTAGGTVKATNFDTSSGVAMAIGASATSTTIGGAAMGAASLTSKTWAWAGNAAPNPGTAYVYWGFANQTALTASSEAIDFRVDLNHTVQFATGALTTQRAAVFNAPAYAFVGASTITDAVTLEITGSPIASTNATITNRWAFRSLGNTKITSNSNNAGTALIQTDESIGTQVKYNGNGFTMNATGVQLQQSALSPGQTAFTITPGAHTNSNASTELVDINVNLNRNVQFATGALATQRAILFQAPTYSFVGASTITNAATVYITGAPIAGTNATILESDALWVASGNARFDGKVLTSTLDRVTAGTLTIGGTSTVIGLASQVVNLGFANTSAGQAPTFTTRSTGEKITLYPALSGSAANFAIGVDNSGAGFLWMGTPTTQGFQWYGGTTLVAQLSGSSGTLSVKAGGGVDTLTFGDLLLGGSAANVLIGNANSVNYLGGSSGTSGSGVTATWNTVRIFGNSATNVSTLQPSNTLDLISRYWNGSASADATISLKAVPDSTAPAYHFSLLFAGSELYAFDASGNVTIPAGGSVDTRAAGTLFYGHTNANFLAFGGISSPPAEFDVARFQILQSDNGVAPFSPGFLYSNSGNTTAMAASLEHNEVYFSLSTGTFKFATGSIATERLFLVDAPTISFTGASTVTNAATFAIGGAPAAGTNATITNSWALWVQGGIAAFDGGIGTTQTTLTAQAKGVIALGIDVANGTLPFQINTSNTYTSTSALFSVKNAGTQVAAVDASGRVYATGGSTGGFDALTATVLKVGTVVAAGVDIGKLGNGPINLNCGGSGGTTVNQSAGSGTPGNAFSVVGGTHTALTASTENVDVNLSLARTVQFATGALTTQRAVIVQPPTYGFVAASTLTNAATFAITGAPTAGSNATITNSYALWVQAGAVNFGQGTVTQTTSITTGVTVNAASGKITTVSSTLAAVTSTTFTVTNNCVKAASIVIVELGGYSGTWGTNGSPQVGVSSTAAGSFVVRLYNAHASAALSGTLTINFVVT